MITPFGRILRQCREQTRLTQVELADLSAVSVRAIRNLELGSARNPRRETVRLLADAMRLSGDRRAALHLAAGHQCEERPVNVNPAWPVEVLRPLEGRDREVTALMSLLTIGERRIVRISGLSGVGKTHLAHEVAARLLTEHRIPSHRVALDSGADTGSGTPDPWAAGLSVGDEQVIDEFCRLLGGRSQLLVLDGADNGRLPEPVAKRIAFKCPNTTIVIVSRLPSGRGSAHAFPLRPLCWGDALDSAPQFLLSRVRGVDPYFVVNEDNLSALTEICGRLDGIPRALDAAASWFSLSHPSELARVARDEPLLLTVSPDEVEHEDWVHDAVLATVASLTTDVTQLFDWVADRSRPWSMDDISDALGLGRLRAARGVHELLTRGLVRPEPAAGRAPVRFIALNLVREVARAKDASRLAVA
ncbi:helix-turn-helix domain-containing protein [Streptomyces sp. NPDC059076]|uniref:helix-turn-helix domain-containing protein n=1 Tax=unclassified Streptomyces TaxID=2593676 RepID=UPI0036C0224C